MRVLSVTWEFPEPAEQFVTERLTALASLGHDVRVLARPSVVPLNAVERSLLDVRRMREGRSQPSPASQLLAAAEGRDIVHFEWARWALRFLDVIPRLTLPVLVTCHGSDVRVYPMGSQRLRDELRALFTTVERVHCISDELATHAFALGAPRERTIVVRSGVDTRFFSARPAPEPHDGTLRLVSVGRLHWVKGYEYAVHALRLLRDRGIAVSYTIVGADDGGGEELLLAARDLGVAHHVRLAGQRSHTALRAILADADIYLSASVTEGISVAMLEAMSMGLPVVATDAGGTREALTDGVHGILVPLRDPMALADACARLSADTPLRMRMGSAGAREVRRSFDRDTQLDELLCVYDDVLARRAA